MNTKGLIAGVAIAALAVGGASAKTHKRHRAHKMASSADMYASPAQPIPYTQLDAYMKASPSQRASMDMSSGGAAAG
nr:hypothetical protein [Caulobacteraceae bacterium]